MNPGISLMRGTKPSWTSCPAFCGSVTLSYRRTATYIALAYLLHTGQPPHHKPRHRRIDEGLTCGAQPLVIFGHPPVVAYPCEGTLHHPPSRQDTETLRVLCRVALE